MSNSLSFLEAAERMLIAHGEPMHYRAITKAALDGGFLVTQGKTPEASLNAQISVQIKEQGGRSTFVRTEPGVFGLRTWLEEGKIEEAEIHGSGRPQVPHFPTFDEVRAVLPAWDGSPTGAFTRMNSVVWSMTGTPQDQVDWTNPDEWIEARLEGEVQEWARTTWLGSGKRVSPRYVVGHWLLVRNYELLVGDEQGVLRLSATGKDFLTQADGATVERIDRDEGLLWILRAVAEAGSAAPADLLDSWFEYLHEETNVRAESVAKAHLSHRLRNLLDRGYVSRTGRSYAITAAGLSYLERAGASEVDEDPEIELGTEIRRLQAQLRQQVRDGIQTLLADMDPFAFEELIQRLLDAMGYQDTATTSRSNDGGVDVLGTIKVGISEIKEVVQVKRQQANVGRPVLDSLRGSLYRFDAVQGTIITTAGFSRDARTVAFDRGAAPITLIDGETLIDLLIEHEIGVSKRKIELWSLQPDAFVATPDSAEEGEI